MAYQKLYVAVKLTVLPDGTCIPTHILHPSHTTAYPIDKILQTQWHANKSVGARGLCYTILLSGKQRFLYYEASRFFLLVET